MATTRRNVTEPGMVEVIPSVPLHLLLLEGQGCWCTRNAIRRWQPASVEMQKDETLEESQGRRAKHVPPAILWGKVLDKGPSSHLFRIINWVGPM